MVFVINLILTIWAATKSGKGSGHGEGVLAQGPCDHIRLWNTAAHFLINMLSTVLLSSSNYCMQCLSAPTRREVDEAHARGSWMDIGIPSVRNLGKIARKRTALWWLLGLSSLPLHLLFVALQASDSFLPSVKERRVNWELQLQLGCFRHHRRQ